MRVTASIVTYNTERDELQRCVDSLIRDGVEKIYISDNSEEESLRSFCEGNTLLEYIFNNKNLGYGAGHNVAIRRARAEGAEYHLVINADVCFEAGVVPAIVRYMDAREDVAMVHPKVYYPNGELQYTVRLLPSPKDLVFRRFLPKSMVEKNDYRYLLKFADHTKEMNIPYHQGSFLFFRTKCFESVGLFDERYFLYPEDIDITRRMHKHFKTMYYPEVSVVHKHSAASYKSVKMLWIHIVNMAKYFNKWGWIFDEERKIWNKQIVEQYSQE